MTEEQPQVRVAELEAEIAAKDRWIAAAERWLETLEELERRYTKSCQATSDI